ncbi:MAG: cytochrome c oxidase assembly protein [Candidatus Binatia bacterium]|nr:cytochrome c oxidase assembly protein [Candidatus Binatia bacterium]
MNPVASAAIASWRFEPWLLLALVATAWIYLRGRRRLVRDLPERLPPWRGVCFVSGLAVFFVAVASPLDAFADLLLQVHMTQHFLLMMVAPPLLWLGRPELPLLHGLPHVARRDGLGPFLGWRVLHRVRAFLTHPVVCWLAFAGAMWIWHLPALYETALRDPFWHEAEHASFFFASLLFWFPVIQPWPSRPRWSRWMMVPYLFLASLQATAFSALFVFSGRVIYPVYANAPRLGGMSALEDQKIAGAVMWVPGSFVLLASTMLLVVSLLAPKLVRPGAPAVAAPIPNAPRRGTDVLRWPGIGAVLRARSGRAVMQVVLLLIAAVVIVDGFFGPQMGAMSLAGVVPWTYARAGIVIGLLLAGNLFCMACPFLLPRTVGRKFFAPSRAWPAVLRSKWFAVALFVLYLWGYEVFALWDSPLWTAWILLGYFVTAFVVDGLFKGASFCKYVCPIGQFNFVGSLISPLEVTVRSADACGTCTTQDCIRGREGAPGCELDLFLPAKVGNLDCTFCMDCVRACPHDNVGLLPRLPASELIVDPPRAGLGRLGARPDVAALALVVVFGAFVNAAGMVEPVVAGLQSVSSSLGFSSTAPAFTVFLLMTLIVLPLALAATGRWWGRLLIPELGGRTLLCRLALALVPLGMAMWADHFLFHLVTGAGAALPTSVRALGDVGMSTGPPDWSAAHSMAAPGDGFRSVQILLLDLGLLASLYLGWRVVRPGAERLSSALAALAPWATVASLLFVAGVWILFQPMEMRGMIMP